MIAPFGNIGCCANTLGGTTTAAALTPKTFKALLRVNPCVRNIDMVGLLYIRAV